MHRSHCLTFWLCLFLLNPSTKEGFFACSGIWLEEWQSNCTSYCYCPGYLLISFLWWCPHPWLKRYFRFLHSTRLFSVWFELTEELLVSDRKYHSTDVFVSAFESFTLPEMVLLNRVNLGHLHYISCSPSVSIFLPTVPFWSCMNFISFLLWACVFFPSATAIFIRLFSSSSRFCSSGLKAYFVSYSSHLLSPYPGSHPPKAISHSVTCTSFSTRVLLIAQPSLSFPWTQQLFFSFPSPPHPLQFVKFFQTLLFVILFWRTIHLFYFNPIS